MAGPCSEDNLFTWEAYIAGPQETMYEDGCFRATLEFPKDYPLNAPVMTFTPPLWHPNIYADGKVCISILHAPGEDKFGYEQSCERWSPVQSVEKILMSVMSMLAEPNDESPANIDAAKQWRNDRAGFKAAVRANVCRSLGVRCGCENVYLSVVLSWNVRVFHICAAPDPVCVKYELCCERHVCLLHAWSGCTGLSCVALCSVARRCAAVWVAGSSGKHVSIRSPCCYSWLFSPRLFRIWSCQSRSSLTPPPSPTTHHPPITPHRTSTQPLTFSPDLCS